MSKRCLFSFCSVYRAERRNTTTNIFLKAEANIFLKAEAFDKSGVGLELFLGFFSKFIAEESSNTVNDGISAPGAYSVIYGNVAFK